MLPKEHRLRHDKDIKTLFGKAKGVFDPLVGLKFRKTDRSLSRFAVVVGVKVSKKAVVRNRVRRQIRAMIESRLTEIKPGFDVVLLVRPDAAKATREELLRHVTRVLTKAGLI